MLSNTASHSEHKKEKSIAIRANTMSSVYIRVTKQATECEAVYAGKECGTKMRR
jgi:hypothetical protein